MDIILMEPSEPGNIGAVARVMKNFGFTSLLLVNPQCDHHHDQARNRAKHAQDVLSAAKVITKKDLHDYHTLIGTTGRLGTDYNITRSPLLPHQLPMLLPGQGTCGLLFGREGTGLSNEELKKCDLLISIPTSRQYPVLNISHAVGIILYELFLPMQKKSTDHIIPASKNEKTQTMRLIYKLLDTVDFPTQSMRKTQNIVWKRLIGKSFLTHREAAALMGLFRKLLR